MPNYWIFKVNDDSNGKITLPGITIYRHRMEDGAWGIRNKKNGQLASNAVHLRPYDKVVFYLCGNEGHCFLGTATLETGFPLVKLVVHENYLDWSLGVKLKKEEIQQWASPVQIKELEGRLSFFATGEKNWGSHLQGAITKIRDSDYRTITESSH